MAHEINEDLVSPILKTLAGKLGSMIADELGLVWSVKGEMEKLSDKLLTIQGVVEDAEAKQVTDIPILNWLKKLKDAVKDAENILDECVIEDLSPESEIRETENLNKFEVLIHCVVSCFDIKQMLFRHRIAKRIKNLIQRFDDIAKEKSNFHLNLNLVTGNGKSRETSSYLPKPRVYGRDEDKEYIVNLLLGNNIRVDHAYRQGGDVSVCTILGMGGIGKTTLAQIVYNDERIVKKFEVQCWVSVSEDFDPKKICKDIIASSGGGGHDLENLDLVQRCLQANMSRKRFLVVLDDVWNEDQDKWDLLKSPLSYGARGSSVLVTTRVGEVASIISTLPVYSPKVLSDEDCWFLFEHRAFAMTNSQNHPNLVAIGKEIVKKAKGIPLAAKVLGGLLHSKIEEYEWLFVRDSEIWDLPQNTDNAILPVLKLSYNQLLPHSKKCFAYCSIFPKDYRIEKEEMIHLWMANGFIPSKINMELEDVGNSIFHDLLMRSLFQVFSLNEDENLQWYQMHDLVHDLASSIMGDKCLVVKVGRAVNIDKGGTSTTRHLSFDFSYSSHPRILDESSLPKNPAHTRTFLRLDSTPVSLVCPLQLIFSNMKLLCILDLRQTNVSIVPDSICNLKHLKYLNLSTTHIKSLPNEPFCRLKSLQILILFRCHYLQMLPEHLREMTNLRHLDIRECKELTRMPIGMGNLTCLRRLSNFIVGVDTGCGIEELQGLKHLRGQLKLKTMEHVRSSTNARNANLMYKPNLSSLWLSWSRAYWERQNTWPIASSAQQDINISEQEEEVLSRVGEGVQPHPNIKELRIKRYQGSNFPSWIGSCLNLVKISLVGCRRCKHLPLLGELPLLKFLYLAGMVSVKCIGDELWRNGHSHCKSYFPSLKKLDIVNMPNLEEWSSPSSSSLPSTSNQENIRKGVLAFPLLKALTISGCSKLRSFLPLPSSLQDLRLKKCNEMILKISFDNFPPCLASLLIEGFEELIVFPLEGMTTMKLQNLTSLKKLTIISCPKLTTLPEMLMPYLTALSRLVVQGCKDLEHLPEEMKHLNSLEELTIERCHNLKSLQEGLRHQTTLEELRISDCQQLEFLPDDFQHLKALRFLRVDKLPKLISLPTLNSGHLRATLRTLHILNCSSLTSLPGWITDFIAVQKIYISDCPNLKLSPEGLERLTSLKSLEIVSCDYDLPSQWKNYKRDHMHQLAHIGMFRCYSN